jgi:Rieske Fe-S protein
MTRKEFLKSLGLGAAAVALMTCLQDCKSDTVAPAPTSVDFTLNLDDAANAELKKTGGYIYKDQIIIARNIRGQYIALYKICSHQGFTVVYDKSNDVIFCPNHGSNFSDDGNVINGPAYIGLRKYNTALTGNNMLRVYS